MAPSLIWTHNTQASLLKREKDKCTGEGEKEDAEDILSFGILSCFDIVLSDNFLNNLWGFIPNGFPNEDLCIFVYCCPYLSFKFNA